MIGFLFCGWSPAVSVLSYDQVFVVVGFAGTAIAYRIAISYLTVVQRKVPLLCDEPIQFCFAVSERTPKPAAE
jgi:hypothetical protein